MKVKSVVSDAAFKRSIKTIVKNYKEQHPDEYKLLTEAVMMQRRVLKDQKFGQAEASELRGLFEISVTLQEAIIKNLSEAGLVWFRSKQGAHWFANEFKEFALPTAI